MKFLLIILLCIRQPLNIDVYASNLRPFSELFTGQYNELMLVAFY